MQQDWVGLDCLVMEGLEGLVMVMEGLAMVMEGLVQ